MKQRKDNKGFQRSANPVISQRSQKTPDKEVRPNGSGSKHPKRLFASKILFILLVAFGTVYYTDSKNYFEPNVGFHEKFTMPSFQKLITTDSVDVCLFGNSHLGNGINAHYLSNALGATCFTFFQAGCDLQDVYYLMYDVLRQTHIKVAVVETYSMTNAFSFESEKKNKAATFKFKTTPTKIIATPFLFDVDEYWAAWSSTVRNHEFIFKDTAQINKNIAGIEKYPPAKRIYLGDTGLNERGIGDSLMAVYDSLGPIMDGELVKNDKYDVEYLEKITKLCKEHNVKLVFLSIPEYHRNLKGYGHWRKVLSDLITPTGCPWIDFQAQYDTLAFRKEFFQNERRVNQHVVYAGVPHFSARLASFLRDSVDLGLPNRTNEEGWKKIFYGTEGYYFYNTPKANDTTAHSICDSLKIGPVVIQNAYWCKENNNKGFYIKIEKNSLTREQANKPMEILVEGDFQGRAIRALFNILPTDMFPVRNYLYKVSVVNDFTPKAIIGLKPPVVEAKVSKEGGN